MKTAKFEFVTDFRIDFCYSAFVQWAETRDALICAAWGSTIWNN